MISIFLSKSAKWNTDDGAGGAHGAGGATETTPWAAPQSLGCSAAGQEHAPGALRAAQELEEELKD